jgi:hypothetical protein
MEELLLVFSSSQRHAALRSWLEQLRTLTVTRDSTEALRLKSEIDEAPEASCDDSNSPTYYAMRALSVASYAADSWNAPDPVECARWASEECLELIRDLEVGIGDRTLSITTLEADAQQRVLARLEVSGRQLLSDDEQDVRLAGRLAELAGEYARSRGWRV